MALVIDMHIKVKHPAITAPNTVGSAGSVRIRRKSLSLTPKATIKTVIGSRKATIALSATDGPVLFANCS